MSIYRDQLEAWLQQIVVKADRVLDVGGGQLPVPRRVKSWDVKEYLILDNDTQYRPDVFADINYGITDELKEKANKMDVIFCLEVMEYVWHPVNALIVINSLLKDDGIAYISFPTQYPLHAPDGTDCLRYMKPGIEKLLAETGFEYWEITPRVVTNGTDGLIEFYRNEGMHPLKGSREVLDIGYCVKAFKKKDETL